MHWTEEVREKARKTVISPITGYDYLIRRLTGSELIEAGISPLISEKKVEKFENDAAALAWLASNADKMTIAQTRCVLINGVVSPKVVYGEEDNLPQGTVHARWISPDENWLYLTILQFSGIASDEHRKQLETILKNVNGSEIAPSSADISVSSPANC